MNKIIRLPSNNFGALESTCLGLRIGCASNESTRYEYKNSNLFLFVRI